MSDYQPAPPVPEVVEDWDNRSKGEVDRLFALMGMHQQPDETADLA